MDTAYAQILASISRHILLSKKEVEFFISMLQLKKLEAGEFLLREGSICKYETFVCSGCLKTYHLDDNGSEHILDFSIEEWWADDLFSLLTQTASKWNIKAIEPSTVLQISRNHLELLYKEIPAFERFFRILYQNAFIAQREQINLSLSASAAEKYQLFLKKKPYAAARFSQKDIAAYLGVTPQFLSRLKRKIRES